MPQFFVTFGQVHEHDIFEKHLDKDTIASFSARDYDDGRRKASRYLMINFAGSTMKWNSIPTGKGSCPTFQGGLWIYPNQTRRFK